MATTQPFKRTKILAGIGATSNSYEVILAMMQAGMDACRFNFSHGNYEERLQQTAWIRQAAKECGKQVAIVQDLQGPRIRLGDFDVPRIDVHTGQELRLTFGATYDGGNVIPMKFDLSEKARQGERIFIFDGKIRTTVIGIEPKTVIVRVENDGFIMQRKGVNLPDTDFGGDILTEKDLADIEFGAKQDFDYVALSFVQTAGDIVRLRQELAKHGSDARVIAKIETPIAIREENLEEIVKVSDGLMVARNDLSVETGVEVVPIAQRRMLELCRKHGKLCIVASQAMVSMMENPGPTRAEVSDVAYNVMAGADCLMLSDETTNGKYPVETVATMDRVIRYTEQHVPLEPMLYRADDTSIQDAMSSAAVTLAHQLKADGIVCETNTGQTARSIANRRPCTPIIAVTAHPRVAQQVSMLYGTKSVLRPTDERASLAVAKELREQSFFPAQSKVVLVSGRQPGLTGGTDTIRVRVLE